MHAVVAVLALMLAFASPSGAQSPIPTGSEIRVRFSEYLDADGRPIADAARAASADTVRAAVARGRLVRWTDDALTLRTAAGGERDSLQSGSDYTLRSVPLWTVQRLMVRDTRRTRLDGFVGGVLIGALLGTAIGSLALIDCTGDAPCGIALFAGMGIGAGAGGLIGLAAGADFFPSWREVPLPPRPGE